MYRTGVTPTLRQSPGSYPSPPAKRAFNNRHSTFDNWPQYIFPSKYNTSRSGLRTSYFQGPLDIPYAFSHHQATFYWTREDALSGHMWNISARPPCVNCIYAGYTAARKCDRVCRQYVSRGKTVCCTRCEHYQLEIACIETVEIRILPKFLDVLGDGRTIGRPKFAGKSTDLSLWTKEEKERRSQGKVIWRPINLKMGDAKMKAELLDKFTAAAQNGGITWACMNPMLSHEEQSSVDGKTHQQVKVMMKRKVETWDLHDQGIFEEKVWSPPPSRSPPSRPLLAQVSGYQHYKENQRHHHEDGPNNRQSIITAEDVKQEFENLRTQILRARVARHHHQLVSEGQVQANKKEVEWHAESDVVLAGVKNFVELKASFLNRGEEEGYACWESIRCLDTSVMDQIYDLLPGLLHPAKPGHTSGNPA